MTGGAAGAGVLVSPLGAPERRYGLVDAVEIVADGRVRGSMTVADWMTADPGGPVAGPLGVAVDVIVGHATLFARPPEHWAVTTGLAIEVAVPAPAGARLEIIGDLVGADGGAALARGEVRDGSGAVLATATVWTRYTPGLPDFGGLPADAGERASPARTTVEALDGSVDRDDAGRARLTLPPGPLLRNVNGMTHGGVVAAAADVVAAAATDDPSAPLLTSGITASYLRPLRADGPVTLTADVEHRGRRTALTRVEVRDADRRRCVLAQVAGRERGPQPTGS